MKLFMILKNYPVLVFALLVSLLLFASAGLVFADSVEKSSAELDVTVEPSKITAQVSETFTITTTVSKNEALGSRVTHNIPYFVTQVGGLSTEHLESSPSNSITLQCKKTGTGEDKIEVKPFPNGNPIYISVSIECHSKDSASTVNPTTVNEFQQTSKVTTSKSGKIGVSITPKKAVGFVGGPPIEISIDVQKYAPGILSFMGIYDSSDIGPLKLLSNPQEPQPPDNPVFKPNYVCIAKGTGTPKVEVTAFSKTDVIDKVKIQSEIECKSKEVTSTSTTKDQSLIKQDKSGKPNKDSMPADTTKTSQKESTPPAKKDDQIQKQEKDNGLPINEKPLKSDLPAINENQKTSWNYDDGSINAWFTPKSIEAPVLTTWETHLQMRIPQSLAIKTKIVYDGTVVGTLSDNTDFTKKPAEFVCLTEGEGYYGYTISFSKTNYSKEITVTGKAKCNDIDNKAILTSSAESVTQYTPTATIKMSYPKKVQVNDVFENNMELQITNLPPGFDYTVLGISDSTLSLDHPLEIFSEQDFDIFHLAISPKLFCNGIEDNVMMKQTASRISVLIYPKGGSEKNAYSATLNAVSENSVDCVADVSHPTTQEKLPVLQGTKGKSKETPSSNSTNNKPIPNNYKPLSPSLGGGLDDRPEFKPEVYSTQPQLHTVKVDKNGNPNEKVKITVNVVDRVEPPCVEFASDLGYKLTFNGGGNDKVFQAGSRDIIGSNPNKRLPDEDVVLSGEATKNKTVHTVLLGKIRGATFTVEANNVPSYYTSDVKPDGKNTIVNYYCISSKGALTKTDENEEKIKNSGPINNPTETDTLKNQISPSKMNTKLSNEIVPFGQGKKQTTNKIKNERDGKRDSDSKDVNIKIKVINDDGGTKTPSDFPYTLIVDKKSESHKVQTYDSTKKSSTTYGFSSHPVPKDADTLIIPSVDPSYDLDMIGCAPLDESNSCNLTYNDKHESGSLSLTHKVNKNQIGNISKNKEYHFTIYVTVINDDGGTKTPSDFPYTFLVDGLNYGSDNIDDDTTTINGKTFTGHKPYASASKIVDVVPKVDEAYVLTMLYCNPVQIDEICGLSYDDKPLSDTATTGKDDVGYNADSTDKPKTSTKPDSTSEKNKSTKTTAQKQTHTTQVKDTDKNNNKSIVPVPDNNNELNEKISKLEKINQDLQTQLTKLQQQAQTAQENLKKQQEEQKAAEAAVVAQQQKVEQSKQPVQQPKQDVQLSDTDKKLMEWHRLLDISNDYLNNKIPAKTKEQQDFMAKHGDEVLTLKDYLNQAGYQLERLKHDLNNQGGSTVITISNIDHTQQLKMTYDEAIAYLTKAIPEFRTTNPLLVQSDKLSSDITELKKQQQAADQAQKDYLNQNNLGQYVYRHDDAVQPTQTDADKLKAEQEKLDQAKAKLEKEQQDTLQAQQAAEQAQKAAQQAQQAAEQAAQQAQHTAQTAKPINAPSTTPTKSSTDDNQDTIKYKITTEPQRKLIFPPSVKPSVKDK